MAKYVDNVDFEYELIICQARGKASKKLDNMLYLIAYNIQYRFLNKGSYDLVEDQIQEAFYYLYKNWKNYNNKKYNNPMAYFSEIAKRSFTKVYYIYNDINIYRDTKPEKFSLNGVFNF